MPDPIELGFLSGVMNEIHQLWCTDETMGPHETHDPDADPEQAVTYLAMAIWELMDLAEQTPFGVAASGVDLLAELVAAQYSDTAELLAQYQARGEGSTA